MAKGTAEQSLVGMLAAGLEKAGYASMMTPGRSTFASLRPAIEAYATYHGMQGATLEALVTESLQPRCSRPDVDYEPDGTPMEVPRQPEAATIERFLTGDLPVDVAANVLPASAPMVATISYNYDRIPDQGDRFTSDLRPLIDRASAMYSAHCGLRWEVLPPGTNANIRVTSEVLGPGILGMAIVGPAGRVNTVSNQWLKMNPTHRWDDVLYWTTDCHERGHSVGSGHRRGGIMAPVNNLATEWSPADIQWLQQHYGPPVATPEPPIPNPPGPGPKPPTTPGTGTGTATFIAPDGRIFMVTGPFQEIR